MKTRFVILLIAGFIFRLFLVSHAYDKLIFDALGYSEFAKDFLSGKLVIDCCAKNVGYSLFLALVYRIFGVENVWAVRIVHILLDLGTASLLYGISKTVFNKRVANIVFVLYLFNPFTAAFTGLVLAETVTIFYVTMIAFVLSRPSLPARPWLWLSLGFLFGLLLFTRHSFYYGIFVFLFLQSYLLFTRMKERLQFLLIAFLGFFLASSYSLFAYYVTFRKVTLVPPYNLKYEIIYMNYYLWHYPEVEFKGIHPMYQEVVQGYWETPLEKRAEHSQKYKKLFLERLPTDWPVFVHNTAWNIVWLWDKDHLYTYADPFYPLDQWPLRILNGILLVCFAIGIISYGFRERTRAWRQPLFLMSVLLFLYITFLFSLLSNESRHTLAFYPLLTLWAGYGAYRIQGSLPLHHSF